MPDPEGGGGRRRPLPVQGLKNKNTKYALQRTILSFRFQKFSGEHAPEPF